MKTIKQEEPVVRSRFIDCPSCKTRTLKLKKIVQVGRCKGCHESYKIAILFVKREEKAAPTAKPSFESKEPQQEPTLPSWQMPSDTSLFGSANETKSTFSQTNFDWGSKKQES